MSKTSEQSHETYETLNEIVSFHKTSHIYVVTHIHRKCLTKKRIHNQLEGKQLPYFKNSEPCEAGQQQHAIS